MSLDSTPKRFAALAGSVALGAVIIALGEWIVHQVWPPPANLHPGDMVRMGAFMERAPKVMFWSILVTYFVAATVSSYISTRVARPKAGFRAATILGVFGAINVVSIQHPAWFIGGMVGAFALGAFAGASLATLRRYQASAP